MRQSAQRGGQIRGQLEGDVFHIKDDDRVNIDVRLTGATIPHNASCTVTVNVLSNISGSYTNSIAAASVSTRPARSE